MKKSVVSRYLIKLFPNVSQPRLHPEFISGSSRCQTGFTLIELLVVVLIIGILAAVALPQYQIAVEKSKILRLLPLLSNITQAQESFYLANGTYAYYFSDLDVSIPTPNRYIVPDNGYGQYAYYDGFYINIISGGSRVYVATPHLRYGRLVENYTGVEYPNCKDLLIVQDDIGRQIAKSLGGTLLTSAYYCMPS